MRTKIFVLSALLFCVPAGRAQAPPLTGIAHMAFRVADLEKSRDFYGRLGFAQAFDITQEGKTTVSYVKINDRQFIELYARTDNAQQTGLMHFCLESDDLAAVQSFYAREQLNPSEVKKARLGNSLFTLHDPEGQLVEYTQYLPGSRHSLDRGQHLGTRRISEHLLGGTTPVRDVAAECGFYTTKLGFEGECSDGFRLRLPGDSREEIDLQPATTIATPVITFAVQDSKRASRELRRRGFIVQTHREGVSVTDPDGVRVAFRQLGNEQHH